MNYVKTLSLLNKDTVDIAGGKGASLGEMLKVGIPVPPAFVVLASAFEKFIEKAGITADIYSTLNHVNHNDIN